MDWTNDKLVEMFSNLEKEIDRREKKAGRSLYIDEVMDTICDITETKKEAVVLAAFFTFADIYEQEKKNDIPKHNLPHL
jgi:hypothetical protein